MLCRQRGGRLILSMLLGCDSCLHAVLCLAVGCCCFMPHCQESAEFQAVLVHILPHLRQAVHARHYVEHKCELCEVPVVTLDAKYGLTCALCNHREGGVVEFPQVECSVMFGCQRPPLQSGLYCCDHHPSSSCAPAPADARRILRHRDDNGVRRYKVDASPHWFSSSELSIRAIQEYEGLLAEKKARRKRRRGQPLEDPNDNGPPPEDAPYFDAVEPIMNPQPDDVNPCGIDKAATLPRRKYGGLLVATLPCGRICAVTWLQRFETKHHSSIAFQLVVRFHSCTVVPYVAPLCPPRFIRWPTQNRSLRCIACFRRCSNEVMLH